MPDSVDPNARALDLVRQLLALGAYPRTVEVGDVCLEFATFDPPRAADDGRPRPSRVRSYSERLGRQARTTGED